MTRKIRRTPPPIRPYAGLIGRLSFTESLDPGRFAEAAEHSAYEQIKHYLGPCWADGTEITMQGLRQWAARGQMIVEASPEATSRLAAGAARVQRHGSSGRRLANVVNTKTGRTVEMMKEARLSSRALAGAAATSAIAVSAAHMISAADLARKLNEVNQKIDLLLTYRRVDQDAALERIFVDAKELLSEPLDELRRTELWRLRGQLHQLRITWRRELEHHLRQIGNLNDRNWFDRMTTVRPWYDDKVSGKISQGEQQIMMVEYSLRLDLVLADAIGTWDAAQATLRDELDAIACVGTLLKEKADFISKGRRAPAQKMAELLEAIVAGYRSVTGENAVAAAAKEITAAPTAPLVQKRLPKSPRLLNRKEAVASVESEPRRKKGGATKNPATRA